MATAARAAHQSDEASAMSQEMESRVCLVTGASAGIGYETALGLAHQGATVVLVARDRAKGEDARRRVTQTTGNDSIDLLIATSP